MKKTFLILLVLLCVATMTVASASAADDMVSDDSDAIDLDNNAISSIDSISSTESDFSTSDNLAIDNSSKSISDDSGTKVKSLGAAPLKDGTTIYVSTTGDDSKDGSSEETAVATIAHAVEIAGDGSTISIANGQYCEGAISLPTDKSLSFLGAEKDMVIISSNATGNSKYFFSKNTDASSFVFKNLVFTGLSSGGTSMAIKVGGTGTVDVIDCTFKDIVAKVGIQTYTSGDVNIINCTFKNIYAPASASWGALYFSGATNIVNIENTLIDGVGLDASVTGQYAYNWGAIYNYADSAKITIKNSNFTNVKGPTDAVIVSRSGLDLIDCNVYNNSIAKTSADGYGYGLIHTTYEKANVNIVRSSFFNNTVYALIQATRGNVTVSNSAFYDNVGFGGSSLININATSTYDKTVVANSNWWGSNDSPNTAMDNASVDNWVIMTASASEDSVDVGEDITITADFSKYTDGTATGDVTGTMPKIPVEISNDATKGSLGDIAYDDNKAIVSYTGVAEGADTVTVTSASESVNIPITVIGTPTPRTIYVSTTGDDSKDGLSEANAVATVSKAVQLAEDGDTIFIANGEYSTAAIDIPASKSLSFVGAEKDQVTIKGTGSYIIGLIESGSALAFENLTFTGIDATGSSTGLKVGGNSTLDIVNCTFTGINAKYGSLWTYTTNEANIKDCTFKDVSCSVSGGAGAVYMTNGDVIFDNCLFDGVTFSLTSGYMYGAFYQTNGNLTISNSVVTNVDAYANAVLRTSKLNTFVKNTTFVNNTVRPNPNNYNNYGEAILQAAGASAHLTVEGCTFVDNKARFGVVQVQRTYGNISYCAFLGNSLVEGEGDLLLINASSTYDKEIYANYNFYGTNDNPSDLVAGLTPENWVILSASPSADSVDVGEDITITADFTKYTDGTTTADLTGTMPEIPVEFSNDPAKGTISDITYEDNKAIVTYTGVGGGTDTVTVSAASASVNIPITVIAPGPATIYVSTTGDDSKDGLSEANAVATIAHAIEIAQDGSTIIIGAGEYSTAAIDLAANKSLSFVGAEKDQVTIKGTGAYIIGLIESGSALAFENLTFTGIDATGSSTGLKVGGNSTLDIVNCTFTGINAKYGSLWTYTTNEANIKDCTFKDVSCSVSGGAGAVYMTNGDVNIDNCLFDGVTFSLTSGYMYGAFYQTNGNLTISNSVVTNVDAYANAVLRTSKLNTFVKNTTFVNNTVRPNPNNYNNYGEAILQAAGASAHLTVEGCSFIDNKARFGVVQVQRTYGNISYCAFLGNSLVEGEGDLLLINASSTYDKEIYANYNFYGTNDNPSDLVAGLTPENWVLMSVSPDTVDSLKVGSTQTFAVDFKHYTDGTAVSELTGSIPEITVSASALLGAVEPSEIETVDNEASFTYTASAFGDETVTFTVGNLNIPISFNVKESIIYVAKDGSPTGTGEEDDPVDTIARAIELANAGKIIVNEGTYTETEFTISNDLVITGVGEVIIDANNVSAKMFNVASTVSNFELNNVAITKANQNFGAVLYNNNAETTVAFNNVSISESYANGYSGSALIVNKGTLTIADSSISNNGPITALIYNNGGVLTINNTVFENNTVNVSTACNGAIESTGNAIVTIENSNFTNIGSVRGAVYSGSASSEDAKLTIANSNFENCSALLDGNNFGYGGAVHSKVPLNVSDSTFINSKSYKDGAAIYAEKGGEITNSVFMGGASQDGDTGEIYTGGDLTLSNNVLIKTSTANKYLAKAASGIAVTANDNYWGTDNVSSVVSGFAPDTWIIMNVEPTETTGAIGEAVEISIDFKHTNSTAGEIGTFEGTLPQEITVYASVQNGTLSASEVVTENLAAKVYFTPEYAGDSSVLLYAGIARDNVPVTVTVAEPYNGPIYVSKDGSDSNEGSFENPVATIAKAVEIASAKDEPTEVIIEEGIYNENGIVINAIKPISIIGNGTVIIRGNNHNVNGNGAGLVLGEVTESTSIMTVDTTEAVLIGNIQFADNIASRGGAININSASGGLKDRDVTIENCTFDNLEASRGGAIYAQYINGSVLIKDSNFTANKASGWGGAVTIAYSAYDNDCLELEIVNSNFENNSANNGGALYLVVQDISIKDSVISNNNATVDSGAIYMQNCTAVIDNCTISNNSAASKGAAISILRATQSGTNAIYPSDVTIANSIIENNAGRENAVPAIHLENSKLSMSYSSVVNEMNLNNTVTPTYGEEQPETVIVNNNWWGTNDPSETILGSNITMDNWVIMNVVTNATNVSAGENVKVTVDFNHVNTTAGEIEELTGGVIPRESYTVEFTVENGTIEPQTVEVPKGGSADAIFTAAEPFATVTATSEKAIATLIFEGEIPEPYTGIVYVSKDGGDANNGSEEAPVASIAKAIEIATAESGSGEIIVNEGTYTGYGYYITKDLSITGVGDVIIDGEGQGQLFNITDDPAVEKFALANLTLTGANYGYGAAVYSRAKSTELNNVTIINNPGAGDLISNYGNLTIVDSTISGHDGGDVIQSSGDVTIVINNTLFENNIVTQLTSDFGIVYVSSGKANVIVEDSHFINNTARQGIIIGSNDANITVKGSEFINNTNTVSYGGAIRASSKLDVTESVFINNNAYRAGGAIYVGFRGDANISKSLFINNSAGSGYYGDAIYNGNKATANYNIFLSNGTKYVIYNDGEDNVVNAQYNWWGTNDDPKDLNGKGTYEDDYWEEVDCADVDSSKWIVMNVEVDTENVEAGASIPVTVDFKHYLDENGEAQELADSLAQELNVSFESETGTFDDAELSTVDHVATTHYTVAAGMNNITVKSADAVVSRTFMSQPKQTTLNVAADPIVAGGVAVVNVTLVDADGAGIDGTVIVTVNGTDKEAIVTGGVGTAEFEGLSADTYDIVAKFNATDLYTEAEATGSLTVNHKATSLNVAADPVLAGDAVVVNVTLVDADGVGIDGTVIVTVNGTDKEATVTGGVGSAEFTGLAVGDYDISAKFNATDIYAEADATGSVSVSIRQTSLHVAADPVVEGDVAVVNVTLVDGDGNGIDGTVLVTVNGTEKEATVTNGVGSAEFTGLAVSTYDISAKFDATEIYAESTATGTLVVTDKELIKTTVSVSADPIVAGDVAVVNVTLVDADGAGIDGTVIVTVNGTDKEATVTAGAGKVEFEGLTAGTYDISARFDATDDYNSSDATGSLAVSHKATSLNVAANPVLAGDVAVVNVTLVDADGVGIDGTVIVTVNGTDKEATVTGGVGTVEFEGLAVGDYDISAKFEETPIYAESTATGSVSVSIRGTSLSVAADPVLAGDAVVVNVTLVDADGAGIDGTVIVTINGTDKEATVTAGAGKVEFEGLAAGTYDISAKFEATDIYAEADATGSVSVSIRGTSLSVAADPVLAGDAVVVNVTLVDADGVGIDGTVIVTINGTDKEATVTGGVGSAEFEGLAVGDYDISAKFNATDIYAEADATGSVSVSIRGTSLSVAADSVLAGDAVVVNVTLVDADGVGIDGTVIVTINGTDKEATVTGGVGTAEFTGLAVGDYDISAKFEETPIYAESTATGSVSVSIRGTSLSVVADPVLAGDAVVVNVTLVDADGVGIDGTVIVTVNGTDKEVAVTAGAGSAEFTGLAVGDYDISAKFEATEIYAEAEATGSVSVSIRDTTLTVVADPIIVGDVAVVNVTLLDADGKGIDGTVIVTVNGTDKEVAVTAGAGSAEFEGLAIGTYDISAKFEETPIYAEADATGSLVVTDKELVKTTLTVSADPAIADGVAVVNVTLVDADGKGIDGTVIVTVNGTEKEAIVTAGAGSAEFTGLAAGTYDISAKFEATEDYNSSDATGSLTVDPKATALTVSADPVVAGDVAIVNVTLVDADGKGIDGTVIVTVNGTDKEATVTAGAGSAEFTGLKAGTYDISAKFEATGDYAESAATGSLTVNPKATALTVSADPVIAGDVAVVNVTLVDADGKGIDGTVIVTVNGTDKEATVTGGVGTAEFEGLAAGTYDISAKFNAAGDYDASEATGSLIVNPKATALTVAADPVVAGDVAVVNVTLVDADGNGIDGTVIVTVNGTDKEAVVTAGAGTAEFEGLAAGTYDISAKFEATGDYDASEATGSLTVNPKATTLTVAADPVLAGDAIVVNVTLLDADGNGIDGTVIVTVNGTDKEAVVTAGAGTAEFDGLKAGTYDITAKFEATGDYDASEATGSLTVEPKESKLSIVVDDVVTGESSKITATLTDADGNPLNGTVKVTVNGKEYPIEVVYGKGSVTTDPFEEIGTTNVVAKFDGDESMAPVEVESQITTYGPGNVTVKHTDAGDAADIQAAIDAASPGDIVRLGDYDYTDVADVNVTKDVTIAGSEGTTVTSAADGTPIFNIPAKSENGPESVNITGVDFKLSNGDTVVKATAENDTSNPLSIVTPNINIKGNTFETVNDTTVPESINVLELDSERGVLSPTSEIAISGNTMTAGVNPFEFEVTSIESGGDVNISPQNVTPKKEATIIVYNNMSTTAIGQTDGRTGEYFYFNLTDSNGKPIPNTPMQIGFNGKVYTYEDNNISTDENGTAKLQINLGYKGDYTFAICFLGDDKYDASFAVAIIKVDVQKPKLTAPNKSYNRNAKTKTLTATFKTNKGNPIVGKSIKFTVNGKTYSGKTNENGVATVKVSLNKKGTYNFTVKYGGDSTYAAVSQKAKLTIK